MSKLGKPLTLSLDSRDKLRNQVYRIGIELEGGWRKVPIGTKIVRDGSVNFDTFQGPPEEFPRQIGELVSAPMPLEDVQGWLKAYYPSHVNATCGMHVHLSFKTALTYQRLMNPAYPATIVAYVKEWAKKEGLTDSHHIWDRLNDKSRYCRHLFHADQQVQAKDKSFDQGVGGHRYTVINYCYSRWTTLECRLLPMMTDHAQAYRAITELVDITNAFLKTDRTREEKVVAAHVVQEDMIRSQTRVRI